MIFAGEMGCAASNCPCLTMPWPLAATVISAGNVADFSTHAKTTPNWSFGTAGAGTLRALAVAGKVRSPQLPNAPTLAEAGLKDCAVGPWSGVFGPAGMAPQAVGQLSTALREALAGPAVKERLQKTGFTPGGATPEALGALAASGFERLGRVAREAKMSAD